MEHTGHERMPFGKHKDKFIWDLPRSYVEWLVAQRFMWRDRFDGLRGLLLKQFWPDGDGPTVADIDPATIPAGKVYREILGKDCLAWAASLAPLPPGMAPWEWA